MLSHETILVLFFELFGVGLNESSASLGDILIALGIF